MPDEIDADQLVAAIRRIQDINDQLLDLPETKHLLTVLESGELPEEIASGSHLVAAATDRRLIVVRRSRTERSIASVQSLSFDGIERVRSVGTLGIEIRVEGRGTSLILLERRRDRLLAHLQRRLGNSAAERSRAVAEANPRPEARDDKSVAAVRSSSLDERTKRLKAAGVEPSPNANGLAFALFVIGFVVSAVLNWVVDVGPWVYGIAWTLTGASMIAFFASQKDTETAAHRAKVDLGLESASRTDGQPGSSGLVPGAVAAGVGIIILAIVVVAGGSDGSSTGNAASRAARSDNLPGTIVTIGSCGDVDRLIGRYSRDGDGGDAFVYRAGGRSYLVTDTGDIPDLVNTPWKSLYWYDYDMSC